MNEEIETEEDELEQKKQKNFEERLDFLDLYVEKLKQAESNEEWAENQKKIVEK